MGDERYHFIQHQTLKFNCDPFYSLSRISKVFLRWGAFIVSHLT